MKLRKLIADWMRGRDAIVVRLPIGFGSIRSVTYHNKDKDRVEIKDVRLPSLTLFPGESMTLNIDDKFTVTLEPVHIADHVFGIQIVKCFRHQFDPMELSEDA